LCLTFRLFIAECVCEFIETSYSVVVCVWSIVVNTATATAALVICLVVVDYPTRICEVVGFSRKPDLCKQPLAGCQLCVAHNVGYRGVGDLGGDMIAYCTASPVVH